MLPVRQHGAVFPPPDTLVVVRQEFDPGYGEEPFRSLCLDYPDGAVYPHEHFRLEWGAVFHRGRLDGSARVLVIGLAPGQLEVVVRRVIVGHAGQRLQGLLAKLGIERSYVMVNAFLYSAYGHAGLVPLQNDPLVVEYRHRWLSTIFASGRIEAVIALGARADTAWKLWCEHSGGAMQGVAYASIPHPTQPESAAKDDAKRYDAAMERMLGEWNAALRVLKPAIRHPDVERPLIPYGRKLLSGDTLPIPSHDLPPGLPVWMGCRDHWTHRSGETPLQKRGNLTIDAPREFLPGT